MAPARRARDDAARVAHSVAPQPARQRSGVVAERVDQVQLGAGLEHVAEHDGRRALVDADLDDAPARRAAARAQHARVLASECIVRGGISPCPTASARRRDVVAQAVGREAAD